MNVNELIERLLLIVDVNPRNGEQIVSIPITSTTPIMGSRPSVEVQGAVSGFDWNSGKLFLVLSEELTIKTTNP